MFSGIIESQGKVKLIEKQGTNKIFSIEHTYGEELYIDQSISHNGVCLTIIHLEDNLYKVEAIKETLIKSNLGTLNENDTVNLERCLLPHTRLDGHIVQGHVDDTAHLHNVTDVNGSWEMEFKMPDEAALLIIPKGSISINGISLTVVSIIDNILKVAIIPYTYEHTNLRLLKTGHSVNIEYDIVGKYVINYLEKMNIK
ncbi:riboflavin synthase [Saprospiraceae bacterium]|nr:riboflavin synthase [Saprospiraceae bacterium]